jgi:hypothetical protein
MMWPLHARFPNTIPNPYGSNKEYYRNRDAKDNDNTKLDKDTDLKLGCIMVSEVFGPNEIGILYNGLEKIGWDRDRFLVREETNVDWLKKQRLYGSEGTIHIGWVHRPEDIKKYAAVRYTAQMPKEFSSLLVSISQLTPSITCLSVGFILTVEASQEYTEEINRYAKTTLVPKRHRRSYSIMGVRHVKQDRIRRVREKYRKLSIKWVSENFPAFFTENCEKSKFPTVEFLSLEGFTPFDENASEDRGLDHWSRFVHIDHDFDSWTCTSTPSLKFSFHAGEREEMPNHMTVALRWDELSSDDAESYGSDTLGSRVYFANERLYGIIARYALISYLRELLRSLKETRQLLSVHSRARRSVAEIDQISAFFRRSVGVPSIAREVLELSKNDASFRWNSMGFTQKMRREDESAYEIKDALKWSLGRLSKQLLSEDRDTREYLNQLSSATGTKESISAQRRMELIAYAALIVAVVSLFIAALSTIGNSSNSRRLDSTDTTSSSPNPHPQPAKTPPGRAAGTVGRARTRFAQAPA